LSLLEVRQGPVLFGGRLVGRGCLDGCPADPNKVAPGVCGCGVADVDSDLDGVLDCNDVCPGFDDTLDSLQQQVQQGVFLSPVQMPQQALQQP